LTDNIDGVRVCQHNPYIQGLVDAVNSQKGEMIMGRKKKITVVKFNGRAFTLDDVKKELEANKDWRQHALLRLYSFQTPHEKTAGRNSEYNGAGFNKVDAPLLSSIAEGCKRYGKVTPKQDNILILKLPKYSKQLFYMQEKTHTLCVYTLKSKI
jgi:hypothetical protein